MPSSSNPTREECNSVHLQVDDHPNYNSTTQASSHPYLSTSAEKGPISPQKSEQAALDTETVGLFFMLIFVLMVGSATALFRLAVFDHGLPIWTTAFLRGLSIAVLSALSLPFVTDIRAQINHLRESKRDRVLLVTRGITGGLTYAFYIYSMAYLPAGDAAGVHTTYAVLTAILSAVLLGEMLALSEITAILVAAIGVFLVAMPGKPSATEVAAVASVHNNERLAGIMVGLLSSLLAAIEAVATRGLTGNLHFMTAVFSHGLFSTMVGALGMLFFPNAVAPEAMHRSLHDLFLGAAVVSLTGVLAFFGQCAFARALQLARAGPGALVSNLSAPVVYLFGLGFLGETPVLLRVLGSVLAVGAGGYMARPKMTGVIALEKGTIVQSTEVAV